MRVDFCGTESVHLWPVYQEISSGWISDGKISGRVLYDKDGETFIAPYFSVEEINYTYESLFFGNQTRRDIFASFSMPKKGNNSRGYVSYSVKGNSSADVIYSYMHYTHQKSRFDRGGKENGVASPHIGSILHGFPENSVFHFDSGSERPLRLILP